MCNVVKQWKVAKQCIMGFILIKMKSGAEPFQSKKRGGRPYVYGMGGRWSQEASLGGREPQSFFDLGGGRQHHRRRLWILRLRHLCISLLFLIYYGRVCAYQKISPKGFDRESIRTMKPIQTKICRWLN